MRNRSSYLPLALVLALISTAAFGQAYPDRPIRLVVPYGPGGVFDYHARLLAGGMSKMLGQPVVIENKPGASTMLGAQYVKAAPNDGYTLLWAGTNMLSILPHIYDKIAYKPSDFQMISVVSELPVSLVIDSRQMPGVDSVKSFVEFVKARPGKINYGAVGLGSGQHLTAELANRSWGLKMEPVSYKSTPDVVAALLGGEVTVTFDGPLAYVPLSGAGQHLRILAVTTPNRIAILPSVPTMAELGYPEMTVSSFGGIAAPAGIAPGIVQRLNQVIVQANNDPEIAVALAKGGVAQRTSTAEEFDALNKKNSALWGELIRALNFKLD